MSLSSTWPTISVVIPIHNTGHVLPHLISAVQMQTRQPDELIIVDDASAHDVSNLFRSTATVIRLDTQRGPGAARNVGARQATGDVLAFLDGDCRPEPDWVERIAERFTQVSEQIIMGRITTRPVTFRGRCVAALGFPAGGTVGFERMWPVDATGRTRHISTGNFAIRRELFWTLGGFDETFAYSCEDAEFSERAVRADVMMRFCPEVRVEHPELPSLRRFVGNNFQRGRGNFWLHHRIGKVNHLISMRFWSTKNILRREVRHIRLPCTIGLLGLSFLLQQAGYMWESTQRHKRRPRDIASMSEVSHG